MSILQKLSKLAAVSVAALAISASANAATVGSFETSFEFAVTPPNQAKAGGSYSLTLDQALLSTVTPSTELLWEYSISGQTNVPGFTSPDFSGSVQSSATDIFPTLLSSLGGLGIDLAAVQAVAGLLLSNASSILNEVTTNASGAFPVAYGGESGVVSYSFSDYLNVGSTHSGYFVLGFTDNDPNADYDSFAGSVQAKFSVSTLDGGPGNPDPDPGPTVVPLPASLPLLGAGLLGLWGLGRRRR